MLFRSVRVITCGAAPLGADVQEQAERVIDPSGKLKIQQAWGMSEATLTVTHFPMGEIDPDISGVGYLAANIEAKIVDESGRELGYDEPGEICIRGPSIFPGYWRREKETKEAFDSEGFYKTGDVAVIKKSTGIIHIVDRKKELIKVKGLCSHSRPPCCSILSIFASQDIRLHLQNWKSCFCKVQLSTTPLLSVFRGELCDSCIFPPRLSRYLQ